MLVGAAAAVAVLALFAAQSARADESAWPTAQAKAYHFDFVPYLDPPAKPAAICLVDSGVDITPDTPADSPDGPILERTSLDGGPGTGIDSDHGTYMAMAAGAPMNDWGTVGLWPGLRIVSVRALPQGATWFPFDDYRRAINICETKAPEWGIVGINLSLECNCEESATAQSRLEDAVGNAHNRYGVSVVASVGNNGGPLGFPAAGAGVVGVGAGDRAGALCSFSNRGAGLDVVGPGCNLDSASALDGTQLLNWDGGTSAAAAVVTAALSMLRAYRPELTWESAEQTLQQAARRVDGDAVVDIESAMRMAGLGNLVDNARERMQAVATEQLPSLSAGGPQDGRTLTLLNSGATPRRSRLPKPALRRLEIGRRLLRISVRNRPRQAMLAVHVTRRSGEFGIRTIAQATRRANTLMLHIPAMRDVRLAVRYVSRNPRFVSSIALRRVIAR